MQRLANGNTLIADNGRMKVIEIDKDKKVVWEFDVPNDNKRKTPTMRQVRRLDNGNTLICASTEDKVIEVSPDKEDRLELRPCRFPTWRRVCRTATR